MSEVYDLKFDFSEYLSDDDEIVYGTCEVKILQGRDPKYKSLLYGNVLQKDNVLSQRVQGGKVGVVYKITATAETAKRQVLKLSGTMSIDPDLSVDEDILDLVKVNTASIEPVEMQEVKAPLQPETKTFSFSPTEVKEVERDGVRYGRVSGYASTFGNVDRVGDVVVQGAFKDSIINFQKDNRPVRMLYQHDGCELIGGFIPGSMFEDANGLFVEGEINLSVQRGAEAYALAKQGVLTDMSIGYSVEDFELKDGVRYLTAIRLWEISLVSEPANPKAKITAVKTVDELRSSIKKKSDIEKVLRDAGFSRSSAKFMASLVDNNKLTDIDQEGDVMEEKSEELREEVVAESSQEDVEVKDVVVQVEVNIEPEEVVEPQAEEPEVEEVIEDASQEDSVEEKPAPDQTALEILLALREILAKI